MDGGSGLNIMYAETLDIMGIDKARIRPTRAPFHGIMLGKQAIPIGQINLPITFGNPSNYRTETLPFEVVGFPLVYHTILGQPCYAKFMAVPNYTYLKLKTSSPRGVIIVDTSFQRGYECEVKSYELASATLASEELTAIRKDVVEGAPDTKRVARSFEPTENVMEVLVNPNNSNDKTVRIDTALSPK
ncbi:uncharacterized protein [Miscanthus floridulus]|uniref:uncharacterized protein n=1 Tax=Miscanthus floridulus TaxID=154761 RepID=UPI003459CB2F